MKQTVRFIGVSRLESLRSCISQIRFSVLNINSHEFAKMLFFVIGLIALPIDSFAGLDDFLWRAWILHCDWYRLVSWPDILRVFTKPCTGCKLILTRVSTLLVDTGL